jgi:hypothetical protein
LRKNNKGRGFFSSKTNGASQFWKGLHEARDETYTWEWKKD